jgi:hypothetical protein
MGLMQMLLWRKNFEDGKCPSPGLLQPRKLSLIYYVKPIEKYLAFEPRSGTKSQLYSHYAEMRKSLNLTRQQNLKSKRTAL